MHNELPSYGQAPAGAIRFNTDSNKLEVYIGGPVGYGTLPNGQWMQVDNWSPENQTGGTRGLFFRGRTPANVDTIDYVNIATTGNALDFGNALSTNRQAGATSSRTRGVFGGRDGNNDTIEFVTIASTGDSQDFNGNLTIARAGSPAAISNGTRGIFAGGYISPGVVSDLIDYITIASQGTNAQDFGDLAATRSEPSRANSSTRGIIAGGRTPGPTHHSEIYYITSSTLGNSADFGDLSVGRGESASDSNSVRGVFACGQSGPTSTNVNTIDFITISTLGDAIDFGDTTTVADESRGSSSSTRLVIALGFAPAAVNTIEYVQIMSTGNAIDFGDLFEPRGQAAACSNGHGGL